MVGGRCPLVLRRLGPGTGGTRCRGPGPDCGDAGADDDRGDDQHDAAGAGDDRAEDRRRPPGDDVAIGHAEGHAHDAANDDATAGHGADEATQARRRVGWVVNTTTDTTFESVTFDALGTTVLIEACADITGAEREVRAVLLAIDAACSRFRDDSELMVVNRSGGRPVVLSALAARAVRVALDAAARTGGAVDPTVGAAVRTLGYDITFEQLPSERPPVVHFVDTPGWRTVRLDADGTVRVPDGVVLDLGATAKALAADLAAERAAVTTGRGVLVSIGGDIAVAGEPPATAGASASPTRTAPRSPTSTRPSPCGAVVWRPRRRRCAAGAPATPPFITSSIRRPGARQVAGAPSPRSPTPASTPTCSPRGA